MAAGPDKLKGVNAMAADRDAERVLFDATLRPHRSLGGPGFAVLMAVFGGVSFAMGVAFLAMGAWPVFGYFGLDVLILWLAFRRNYRDGRLFERVRLTISELRVRRQAPNRPAQDWSFQPYWLGVAMDDPPRHESQVVLRSHGRRLVVGSFLTPDERLDFANALRAALAEARGPDFAAGRRFD